MLRSLWLASARVALGCFGLLLASSTACVNVDKPAACQAGQQTRCACADGSDGVQKCAGDGSGFSACTCGSQGGGTTSGPTIGDACSAPDTVVCERDKLVVLQCQGGSYHKVFQCDAGKKCSSGSDKGYFVQCAGAGYADPMEYAAEGTACFDETMGACGFDGRTGLFCNGGKWEAGYKCLEGCTRTGCEVVKPGDTCFGTGDLGCDESGAHILACDASYKVITAFTCPDGERCSFGNNSGVGMCGATNGYAMEGGPCRKAGAGACSFDLKSVLGCNGTVWTAQPCSGTCGFLHPGESKNGQTCAADAVSCAGCF